ncbi:unnamed protein product [Cylindrotheca closterium]|uniref:Cyclin n=1 Tax=Cylindrotheca closterium TaxID=2856 RepID=A0AAD2CGP9_9STRA|nr:unnamed protein product [Cylindrotheca closterium]
MENTPEQQVEGQAIVTVLAAVLERLVNANSSLAKADPGQITKFHALKSPGIGILPYLERVYKYASCSNECFILALIYIDRLIQRNNFLLTELNVHRVVITATLLAAKFFDDAYYNNAYYSKVGGVMVSEMNGLEVDFLFRINFSLHVTPEVFEKYKAELVAHSANMGLSVPAPQIPPSIPEEPESSHQTYAVQQQQQQQIQPQHTVSATFQAGAAPNQIQNQSFVSNDTTMHNAATQEVLVPIGGQPSQNIVRSNTEQMIQNEFTQYLQRATSLPYPAPSEQQKYVEAVPTYHSAPMISSVGIDADQYLQLNKHLYPLETTLVHHHHGMETCHENGYAQGALVAGRY